MDYFLHNCGYNYFTIPKLTYPEINNLIDGFNEEQKAKKIEYEKNKNKYKGKSKGKTRSRKII